jgi:hypothetical protein
MPANVAAPVVLGPDGLTATAHKFGLWSVLMPTLDNGRWVDGLTINDVPSTAVNASEMVDCAPGYVDIDWDAITQTSGIGHDIEARELVTALGCKLLSIEDTKAKAISLFNRLEQSGHEKILGDVAYTDGTVGTAAAEASVEDALADVLDAWYTANGTQAIVHASPGVATLLGSHVLNRTDHAELRTGEKLVIGAGYTALTPAHALFVTGDLILRQSTSQTFEVANKTNNDLTIGVHRTVLVGSTTPMIYADLAASITP